MITARDLTKNFDGFMALDGVSFSFEDGEIFGIIGHNGAGKTTLLKIISGLIAPTSGELFINDIDVVKNPMALKENLGYLPEESRLYETMTAENYLAFFGEIYGLSPQEIRQRSTQTLRRALARTEREEDRGVQQGYEAQGRDRPLPDPQPELPRV